MRITRREIDDDSMRMSVKFEASSLAETIHGRFADLRICTCRFRLEFDRRLDCV